MNWSISRAAAVRWCLLTLYFAALVAVSWKRWGDPVSDVGLDLQTAAGMLDGVVPYADVRYWYGPLGIAVLSGAFAVFGVSLWTAVGVGLAQTVLIAELARRLARRWVPEAVAAATAAVVLAIGFSGTMFNFQLPHTFAATTGLAAVLAALLALSHQRFGWAGVAVGLAALSRPEFLAFAIVAVIGAALGAAREHGWRPAARSLALAMATSLAVAAPVMGWFFAQAGAHAVIFENIVPLDFLRNSSGSFDTMMQPRDLPSIGAVIARGAVLALGVWLALIAVTALLSPGGRRWPAGGEVRAVATTFVTALAAALALGLAGGDLLFPLRETASDAGRMLLAMSGLPALIAAAFVAGAWALVRGAEPPLGFGAVAGAGAPGWTGSAALMSVAAACGLRAYGLFTTDLYATYYAAPLVIVGVIVLFAASQRLGSRQVAGVALIVAALAGSLTAHAVIGNYPDRSAPITAPRGSFYGEQSSARALQQLIDAAQPHLRAGDRRMLVMPQEPGLVFMLAARPALYDTTFLPGVLATSKQDQAAAAQLLTGTGLALSRREGGRYLLPPLVVVSNRNLEPWGYRRSGVDVNVELQRAIDAHYDVLGRFGDTTQVPPATERADAFTLYGRR